MRTFTGESVREIAYPLGGIGTGTVAARMSETYHPGAADCVI